MDDEIKRDLERLDGELRHLNEAAARRFEWSEKEARYRRKAVSLLQLAIDRAVEVKEKLPYALQHVASGLGILSPSEVWASNTTPVPASDRPNVPTKATSAEYLTSAVPTSGGNNAPMTGPRPAAGNCAPPSAETFGNNKTAYVRDYINWNADNGVSPADIKKAAEKLGKLPNNFPYTILGKLKSADEIEGKKGRYYPKVKRQ